MSNAIGGPGFFLQMGDGATPENFTTVSEVHDINGPGLKTDVTDVTNQSSPGGYEEVITSIRRSGEVTCDVNFNPPDATQNETTGLQYVMNNKILKNWRITFPVTSKKYTFAGYVTGFTMKAPVGAQLTASVTIKVTGQPAWA